MGKNKTVIAKAALCDTLRVLHNLWSDGHVDIIELDKILRRDYGVIIQHLEPNFIYVESLDGLVKTSIGIKNN